MLLGLNNFTLSVLKAKIFSSQALNQQTMYLLGFLKNQVSRISLKSSKGIIRYSVKRNDAIRIFIILSSYVKENSTYDMEGCGNSLHFILLNTFSLVFKSEDLGSLKMCFSLMMTARD